MTLYREAKERHPGMILLFRMGDFYELFDSDAETGARVLGLSLTVRSHGTPMAGFPRQSLVGFGSVSRCHQIARNPNTWYILWYMRRVHAEWDQRRD